MNVVRRLVPLVLVPLALIACALANSPWLRAFPVGVIGVPLFGAVLLSVLAPVVVVGIGVRRLALTASIDIVLFVFYELLVTLRRPGGFGELYDGLVHGPAKILSFALPLVGPRTLLVAPVALCWVGGAVLGECLARGWRTVVPHLTMIAVFALAYGGSVRAVSSIDDGRRYDTLFAAALLVTLLLLRAAGAWVVQDDSADATQPGALLPLRGLVIGIVSALVVGGGVVALAQTSAFDDSPRTAVRRPPIDNTDPLTPLSFISSLRPTDPKSPGKAVFTLVTDSPGSAYVPIADVDNYDGDGWSFARTFLPSGGVVPADLDPQLRPAGKPVTQQYTITGDALTRTPWMPFLNRPQRVSGLAVDVDSTSGMVVPSRVLRTGQSYSVQSAVDTTPFGKLPDTSIAAGRDPENLQLPAGSVTTALDRLVDTLALETDQQRTSPIAFLQAVSKDLQTHFGLAGGTPPGATRTPSSTSSPSGTPAPRSTPPGATTGSTTPTAARTSTNDQRAGGTSFADVLASIRQFRSATPEQYATLVCLIARELGVPARVATGFRLIDRPATGALPAGRHTVTAAMAWTWVEIPVAGHGWVTLDPSPSKLAANQRPSQSGARPSPTPTASPSVTASISPGTAGQRRAPPVHIPGSRGTSATTIVLVVVVIVLALLALLMAVLLLRKRWRAARRRRGSPRQQLLGAWRETLDLLEESGLPPLRSATSREVAQVTEARFGRDTALAARQLGDAANVAIFQTAAPVTQEDADAAWDSHAVLAREVTRSLGRREQLRALLHYRRGGSDHPDAGPASWADVHRGPAAEPARRGPLHR